MPEDKKKTLQEILNPTAADDLDLDKEDQPTIQDLLNPKPKDKSPIESVSYTGQVEADALAETDALMNAFESAADKARREGFKARAKAETKRVQEATESEYYFVPCFQTGEQKFAFLTELGLHRKDQAANHRRFQGDYIDGRILVKAINRLIDRGEHISIPGASVKYTDPWSKVDKKLLPFAEDFPE